MDKNAIRTYRMYEISTSYTSFCSWEDLFTSLAANHEPALGDIEKISFDISSDIKYEGRVESTLYLHVEYARPETEIEAATRMANELLAKEVSANVKAEIQKSKEKFLEKEYQKLKKKYE